MARCFRILLCCLIATLAPASARADGPCAPGFAPGDPVPGLIHAGVEALAVYDDGSGTALYAAGKIHIAGDVIAHKQPSGQYDDLVARWDGTRWRKIGDAVGPTYAMTVYDGKLIIGGGFSSVSGVSASGIAAWNGVSWSALGSGVANAAVNALHVHDGSLYAVGNFSSAGGVTANRIARWDGATWSALGAGLGGNNGQALTTFEGDLIVGGSFVTAGGDTANNVARWNGSAWSGFGEGIPSSTISALGSVDVDGPSGPDPERLVAGGTISSSVGNDLQYWNGVSWEDLSGGVQNTVHALLRVGDDLIAGGGFNGVGGSATGTYAVAQWSSPAGWTGMAAGLNPGNEEEVRALAEYAGEIYAGGTFTNDGDFAMYGIARWDGAMWHALSPGLGGTSDPAVYGLATFGDAVVVGGRFTSVGASLDANNIALWTPAGWDTLGPGLGTGIENEPYSNYVSAVAVHGATIYAAWKDYTTPYVSRWNGVSWTQVGSDASSNQEVRGLAIYNGDLYACGSFTTMNNVTVNRVARLSATGTWSALGTGTVGVSDAVEAILPFGGDLIAGGAFTTAGGVSASRVARWDGTTWSAMGSGVPETVYALCEHGGVLYAGASSGLYSWDGAAWSKLFTTTSFSGAIRAMASFSGDLYFTGDFSSAGGVGVNFVARWDGVVVHAIGSGLETGSGTNVRGEALAALSDTSLAVGSNATMAGGMVSPCLARILPCVQTAVRSGPPPPAFGVARGMRLTAERRRSALELTMPSAAEDVRLAVFDVLGREAHVARFASVPAGRHVIPLDLASGVYLARASAVVPGGRPSERARHVLVRFRGRRARGAAIRTCAVSSAASARPHPERRPS